MSQAATRAVIKAYILASAWFAAYEMEPRVGEAGVAECAPLLARPGTQYGRDFVAGYAGMVLLISSAQSIPTRPAD